MKAWPLVVGMLALTVPGFGQELARLGLDEPARLGLKIAPDAAVKVEGSGSIRIETRWPVTVCLGVVEGLSVGDAVLIARAKVRTELRGAAVLEMWVRVDGKEYFSRALDRPVRDRSDWTAVATPFDLKGARADRAVVNLIVEGTGTVWVDDLTLVREPRK